MPRSSFAVALWATVLISASAADGPTPAPPPASVPDPDWRPKAGDRVSVRHAGTVALPDRASCERYARFATAGDSDGIKEVSATPGAVRVDAGVPVLVIEPHGLPGSATGPASSPESLNGDIQDAINRAASRPRPVVSIEARVLDGPHKGAIKFFPMEALARMIAPPAGSGLQAGDRLMVGARPAAISADEDYTIQYAADPAGNRGHVTLLPKGTKLVVVEARRWSVRVKILPPSRMAGRVGYVKADGLESVSPPAAKPGRVR
jgi:hypothetical protein